MKCSGRWISSGGFRKDHRRSKKSSFTGRTRGDRYQRNFSDGILYEGESEKYKEQLGQINCNLAEMADAVVEVVYGIPVWHKGGEKA